MEVDIKKLEKSVFNTLYEIDTRERAVEKDTGKTKLNYLPWATTYSEVCKHFANIKYRFLRDVINVEETETVVVDENTTVTKKKAYKREYPYFDTPAGLEVRTEVTINGETKEMCLPVYDASYKSMGLEPYTYNTRYGDKEVKAAKLDDIYKSIMRCFAKNLSMWGVGLNMWTKEDAPETVLHIEKLIKEIDVAYASKKKKGFADDQIIGTYKDILPEELDGNYKLCDNEEMLKKIKNKILTLR